MIMFLGSNGLMSIAQNFSSIKFFIHAISNFMVPDK